MGTSTHPSEDQLGFFGFTPDGSLVVTVQDEESGTDRKEIVKVGFPDFRFASAELEAQGGPMTRARANLAAVRLLRQLSAEGRQATAEEHQVLARYIGWGPFPGVFVPEHPEWGRIGAEMREVLTDEEWRAAEASTPNANHTPGGIIRFVYRVLARLGIEGPAWDGLQVLESSLGSGAFIGHGPPPESGVRWTGVELEPLAGAVAKALYPSADIRIGGFEHAILPRDAFDLAVGNVPFGAYPVHDPVYNPRLFSIHNYFIAKCVALTRPGGLVAVITSRYTLDQVDTSVRAHLAERADLVAAIRLPDSAFRGRAVQRVTTDLLVLRRRAPGENAGGPAWLDTVEVKTPDGPARINEYYAARPEMMAGHLRLTGKNQFRSDEPAVVLPARQSLEAELERVFALVPEDIYRPRRAAGAIDFRDASEAAGLADGAYKVIRHRLRRWMQGRWEFHGLKQESEVYRVVALCAIRDAQREVLRTQAQECSEVEQEAARAELNRVYDVFVRQYGPINREERFTDVRGKVRIRRPNLDPFRGDPYAMNVAALEQFDAEKSTVRKAAIFHQRVVRPTAVREHADTAEDALLLTLDSCARVDIPTIARLWGRSEEDVIRELEGRIFLNPATQCWETDDDYLSGPVRRKLREAREAREAAKEDRRFELNVHALDLVQPEDVGPSDIHVGLGATWVDRGIVLQFIRELLELGAGAKIQIGYVAKEALWAIQAAREVRHSIRARQVWGTPRAHAIRLIEDLLNQRATVVYDTVEDEAGQEKTVKNQAETVTAQEKAQEIADEFTRWVWRDADRAEYLVRRYNDTFNDVRPRAYDGSHLTFPGLSTAFVPEQHQRDVVWQILSRGSTGVAHVVGAGKTLVAILASMRLRQLGLASKPLHATMGHMLEQYSREFLQAYPQAKLLTAHVEDVSSAEKRRLFFARAASDEYDAIIVTHSAFERLGMSEKYEREFLEAEVEEFRKIRAEAVALEGERSVTVKQLQVIIKQYEARLGVLANREGKDANLSFEELGVDQLFIDEVHLFKNAATRTKIAGIPRASKPSRRAADLMMKCAYLNALRDQHGVVTMTGTLISNTISEAHVHLRYLAPKLLRKYGIEHFDAFAANFIERRWMLEVSPDGGGFRVRERFHFCNMTELNAILSQVVDIQLAESPYEDPSSEEAPAEDVQPEPVAEFAPPPSMAERTWPKLRLPQRRAKQLLKLPRPRLLGGRPETITAPPSKALLAFTQKLVERAERIRMGGVDPRLDNMLAVTNDGRNAALDMRLIDPTLPDDPQSKVNLLVAKVHEIWLATAEQKGTQLIFCDLSTPRGDGRFSVYEDVRRKLIALGVPADEIAFMQDASDPRKKAALQAEVRAGRKRITLGSTSTMGTGTHFPDLIVAMHHLDAPYRPSDIEQRDGRGLRRGNRNAFIAIYRYVTERSFDAYIWNLLHYKLQMINRVLLGDPTIRKLADNDAVTLNFAEVKALATGNPLILEKANLDAEVARLSRARGAFIDRQFRLRTERADFPRRLVAAEAVLDHARADLATRQETTGDTFRITIGEVEYTTRTEGGVALKRAIEEACYAATDRQVVRIGRFAGFDLLASVHPKMQMISAILRGARDYEGDLELFQAPANLAQALEWIPRKLEGIIRSYEDSVAYLRRQVAQLQSITEEPFPHEEKLNAMIARQRVIERELRLDGMAEVRQGLGALATLEESPGDDDDEAEYDEELPAAA